MPVQNSLAINDICSKCRHRATCKTPCAFVDAILKVDNRKPLEHIKRGQIIILYPHKNEFRESDLMPNSNEDGKPSRTTIRAFSTENESAFNSGDDESFLDEDQPTLKQSRIFMDRFFYRMSYQDIAEKYGTTKGGVAMLYVNAKRRIKKTIKAMDRVQFAKNNGAKLATFPNGIRVFLLHTLFELSNSEISKLLGMRHSQVHRYIKQTAARIADGSIDLSAILNLSDKSGG